MKHKNVVQLHHISYNPEIVVPVYQGEHWIIVQRNRRKNISKGYITDMKVWLALHENEGVDLK